MRIMCGSFWRNNRNFNILRVFQIEIKIRLKLTKISQFLIMLWLILIVSTQISISSSIYDSLKKMFKLSSKCDNNDTVRCAFFPALFSFIIWAIEFLQSFQHKIVSFVSRHLNIKYNEKCCKKIHANKKGITLPIPLVSKIFFCVTKAT